MLCGQMVDGVLLDIVGLVETKSNGYLYHRVMLVIQISLTLEELLEDEAVARLTSGGPVRPASPFGRWIVRARRGGRLALASL